MTAAILADLNRQLSWVLENVEIGPDPKRQGQSDVAMMPLDDLDTLRRVAARLDELERSHKPAAPVDGGGFGL